MNVQCLARFILLLLVLWGWFRLADSTGSANNTTGTYLLWITSIQFHTTFYASRMLPNTFALAVVLHAYSEWKRDRIQVAAALLVAATAVFRCDVVLLLFCAGLSWLVRKELGLFQAIGIGVMTGLACLAVIVPLDSHMWRQPWLWSEGHVFYYNTVLGKSSNWGTSPWHWYVSNAIPKAMLLTILLVPLSFLRIPELICHVVERKSTPIPAILDTTHLHLLVPTVGFIGLYSCLGHKEMRFIFPALPVLNLMAAEGLSRLHRQTFPVTKPGKDKQKPSKISRLLYLAGINLLLLTACGTFAFVDVSSHNYPGGEALLLLQNYLATSMETKPVDVYIDVAAAMSGVSLFGQRSAIEAGRRNGQAWTFSKGGYEDDNTVTDLASFTHILTEEEHVGGFYRVAVAKGRPRFNIKRFTVSTRDTIFVMERIGWERD